MSERRGIVATLGLPVKDFEPRQIITLGTSPTAFFAPDRLFVSPQVGSLFLLRDLSFVTPNGTVSVFANREPAPLDAYVASLPLNAYEGIVVEPGETPRIVLELESVLQGAVARFAGLFWGRLP